MKLSTGKESTVTGGVLDVDGKKNHTESITELIFLRLGVRSVS
jgi:hypothetical protein